MITGTVLMDQHVAVALGLLLLTLVVSGAGIIGAVAVRSRCR